MTRAGTWIQPTRSVRQKLGAALTILGVSIGSLALAGGARADGAETRDLGSRDRSDVRTQQCTITDPAGVDWVTGTSAPDRGWTSVTWGNGTFVAVSGSPAGTASRVMTSPDGINWIARSAAADNAWTSVAWGNGTFVAVSIDGVGNRVMTSPDGISWTTQSSAANNVWNSVTWGGPSGQEQFVAVSTSGTGNRVMTSPDGITWNTRTSASNSRWRSVAWGGPSGQENFVAVADGGQVMTSPDGITWSSQTSAANNGWTSVVWGNNAFVAVAESGVGNRVMTSPDGITWTARSAAADNQWNSVAWSGEVFAAVSSTGTGNRVMTSPDGITWTSQTSSADNAWNSVAWGGGAFVAVSATGTGNRVMSSSAQQTCTTPLPRVPPGPPREVVATPSLDGASVTWSPPADSGTDFVNLYAVRAWPGGPVCQVPASTPTCTVMGLDASQDYYFTVVAMSGAGWGAASQPSNTIRPLAPQPPGAPTDVVATPGDAQVAVTWTPPSTSGSSPVREYRVASSPTGGSCTSAIASCTVTGLTNGTAYTFTVEARNDQGWGPASQASAAVTPQAPSVTISGERSGRVVQLAGVTTGIAQGSVVTVWWRFGGQATFAPSTAVVRVDQVGSFAWQRRVNPAKRVEVYATVGDVQSNSVLVPGRRAR